MSYYIQQHIQHLVNEKVIDFCSNELKAGRAFPAGPEIVALTQEIAVAEDKKLNSYLNLDLYDGSTSKFEHAALEKASGYEQRTSKASPQTIFNVIRNETYIAADKYEYYKDYQDAVTKWVEEESLLPNSETTKSTLDKCLLWTWENYSSDSNKYSKEESTTLYEVGRNTIGKYLLVGESDDQQATIENIAHPVNPKIITSYLRIDEDSITPIIAYKKVIRVGHPVEIRYTDIETNKVKVKKLKVAKLIKI